MEEYVHSLNDLNTAVNLNPNAANLYETRGIVYQVLEKYDNAIKDYKKTISLDSHNLTSYKGLVLIYAAKKEYPKAIEAADRLLEIKSDWLIFNVRAKLFFELGQCDKALDDCNKAIKLYPYIAYSYYMRGWIYLQLKEYEKAIKDFDKAISLAPQDSDEYRQSSGYKQQAYEALAEMGEKK